MMICSDVTHGGSVHEQSTFVYQGEELPESDRRLQRGPAAQPQLSQSLQETLLSILKSRRTRGKKAQHSHSFSIHKIQREMISLRKC